MVIIKNPDGGVGEVDYWPIPGSQTGSYEPRFRIYYPEGQSQPSSGWPVYVRYNITTNFFGSTYGSIIASSIDASDRMMIGLLDRGICVVDVKGAYTDPTGGVVFAGGMFVDVLNDQGSFAAWSSPARDLLWAVQHLKFNDSTYGIDKDSIVIESTGYVAIYIGLHPDVSTDDANQNGENSRVQGIVVRGGLVAQVDSMWFNSGYSQLRLNGFFPSAPSIDDALEEDRQWISPTRVVADYPDSSCVPCWIEATGNPNQSTIGYGVGELPKVTIDHKTGQPNPIGDKTTKAKGLSDLEHPWQSAAMMATLRFHARGFHAENSRLVVDDEYDSGITGVLEDAKYTTEDERLLDCLTWVESIIGYADLDELDVDYDWAADITNTRQHVQTRPQTGLFVRRATQSSARPPVNEPTTRAWQVNWKSATVTEKNQIISQFASSAGVTSFLFRPPGAGVVKTPVVPRPGTLDVVQNTGNSYSLSLEVEEAPV